MLLENLLRGQSAWEEGMTDDDSDTGEEAEEDKEVKEEEEEEFE